LSLLPAVHEERTEQEKEDEKEEEEEEEEEEESIAFQINQE